MGHPLKCTRTHARARVHGMSGGANLVESLAVYCSINALLGVAAPGHRVARAAPVTSHYHQKEFAMVQEKATETAQHKTA